MMTYPAKYRRIETYWHWISCRLPPMVKQKEKGQHKLNKVMNNTQNMNPIVISLRYIIRCVINDTMPHTSYFLSVSFPLEVLLCMGRAEKVNWAYLF